MVHECLKGFYANKILNTCNACGTGAAECTSNVTATACLSNYGLSGSSCNKCGSGVADCPAVGSMKCLPGFMMSGNACVCPTGKFADASGLMCNSCSSNCGTCSSETACT